MTNQEFRNLQHGDKISRKDVTHNGRKGMKYVVHNNHRSGTGMVVAVRTEVIRACDYWAWSIIKKHEPINMPLAAGTYEVQVVRRIDNK